MTESKPNSVPPKGAAFAGLEILVVDDDSDSLTYISTVLEDHGASTRRAKDGDEAMALVRERRPDLITLDLGMPGKSGVEVFHELRDDPELREIPVCVITGRPELRKLIYERPGGDSPDGYLNKPVDEKTLVRDLRRILALTQKRRLHRG